MRVLIVEKNSDLADVWKAHLARQGADVTVATSQDEAVGVLQGDPVDVLILNLVLPGQSAIAVADYASYRQPDAKIVFVSSDNFFSDGSLFNHIPNARAFLQERTPPEDLAAIVDHYGRLN